MHDEQLGEGEDGVAVFFGWVCDGEAELGEGSRLVAGCCHLIASSMLWAEVCEVEC